jgi:hypothetical protein
MSVASKETVQPTRYFDNDRAAGYWTILIGLPALLALGTALFTSFSAPMPVLLDDARQYLATGRIADTTFPLEFPWFTALSLRAFGTHGPEALQAVLYLLIVLSVWALARMCGAGARPALIAAVAAAVYPQLPISVTKVWDVELAVLLMVLFLLLTVWLLRDGLRPGLVVAAGVVFGLGLAQRSNMLLLAPLPIWVCWSAAASRSRRLLALAAAGALTVLTLAAVNTAAHGRFFLPQNGAYNLVQGHNEYSIRVMLDDLTCEPSVAMIVKADGMSSAGFSETDPAWQRYFTRRALAYMRSHPLAEVELTAVKFWTVFRPNTRVHPRVGWMTIPIVCMSLIFPVWLIVLVRRGRRVGLDRVDWIFAAAVVLYVLPFLLTSSDPRYQIPIEICLLSHIAYMAGPATALPSLAATKPGKAARR